MIDCTVLFAFAAPAIIAAAWGILAGVWLLHRLANRLADGLLAHLGLL